MSAADGTNVVKIFQEALNLGLDNKLNPPDSLDQAVEDLLNDVRKEKTYYNLLIYLPSYYD